MLYTAVAVFTNKDARFYIQKKYKSEWEQWRQTACELHSNIKSNEIELHGKVKPEETLIMLENVFGDLNTETFDF